MVQGTSLWFCVAGSGSSGCSSRRCGCVVSFAAVTRRRVDFLVAFSSVRVPNSEQAWVLVACVVTPRQLGS